MDALRLAALDAEDLAVISAHMQDAVIRAGDIAFLGKTGKLALIANRFAWDATVDGSRRSLERRRTGLQFARVNAVMSSHIRRDNPDAVLSLLAISFEPSDPPAGKIVLIFSGGGAI